MAEASPGDGAPDTVGDGPAPAGVPAVARGGGTTPPAGAGSSTGRLIALGAAVAALYFATAQVGFRLAILAEQVTTVWAPTGIALATLLLAGRRLWPAIWLGAFGANALSDAPLWTAAAIATGNTLEAVAATAVLQRVPRFDPSFGRVADVLAFVAVAALACTAISATAGVATLCAAGVQPWARFGGLWSDWWLGDALGALVVAPAILTAVRQPWSRRDLARAGLLAVVALLSTHVVFGQRFGPAGHPFEYVLFPLAIVAAVSGGPRATSLVVLCASAVTIWHTTQGAGPFAGPGTRESLILLQVFMGVLAATGLLLAASIAERRTSEQRERDAAAALRHREEMLTLAQRAGGVGTFEWDPARQVARCSAELFRMFGMPAHDGTIASAEWAQLVHADDREAMGAHLARALAGEEPAAADYRITGRDGRLRWLSYAGRIERTPAGDRMLGTVVDVTDRKGLEAELRRRQVRLTEANRELRRRVREQQALLDVLPIGIGIATDPECRHIQTNRAFAATLGLQRDANASKTAPDAERPTNFRVLALDGSEVPDHELPMQRAARDGVEVRDVEVDVVHEDGRVIRLLEYAAPILDEDGRPRGAVGAFVDVTAALAAREAVARSEQRYRRIFETTAVSIWEEDFSAVRTALDRLRAGGVDDLAAYLAVNPAFVDECVRLVRVVDVNEAALRMFAAPSKSALLESLDRVFLPETREVFAAELLAIARGDRHFESETTVARMDGRPVHVLVNMTFPGPGESFDSVLVSLADITHRKLAETALRQEVDVRATLAQVGASLAGELRSERLVQAVTDAATRLTEAEVGVFSSCDDEGAAPDPVYSFAGPAGERFARFPPPDALSNVRGGEAIRIDDVAREPGAGGDPSFEGLPVRSYLAVPVIGRDGVVVGTLAFGHSRPSAFTTRHELLAVGVAGWTAIALDNARLYQEAEEANRLKDEFLATLSHELRTPLSAVLGWAHMLREGTVRPSMRQRALESIERNARAQVQLVEDLLDVSRIMAGKLRIGADPVDLGPVVRDAADTVRAGASAKHVDLRVTVPADRRLVVTGDAARLQQVVWNLVSNAIKFTPAGGRVDVELRQIDAKVEIAVRDTGQGIEPSFQPHLFERFRQVDASMTRPHSGLGLGLSIVRHVTEAHGGVVSAESRGAGHGATFRVVLPLRAVETAAIESPAGGDAVVDRTLSGVRIVVVDDDADARELVRWVLESRGAAVAPAASAAEALDLLRADPFDVLVSDIAMPGQDGLALIRAVRGLPSSSPNRAIAAIAVTAYAGVREREEALAAGFDRHLGKPVGPEELIAAIAALDGGVVGEGQGR